MDTNIVGDAEITFQHRRLGTKIKVKQNPNGKAYLYLMTHPETFLLLHSDGSKDMDSPTKRSYKTTLFGVQVEVF